MAKILEIEVRIQYFVPDDYIMDGNEYIENLRAEAILTMEDTGDGRQILSEIHEYQTTDVILKDEGEAI